MKKIILILCGIAITLSGIIYIIYRRNKVTEEEVVDIFKEDVEKTEKESTSDKEEVKKDKVIVDVKGMVVNPGVYEIDKKARVNDAILLAGGLKEGADTSLINLAKVVEDEMTIIVYSNEEVREKYKEEVCVCDCPLISNDACIENTNNTSNNTNTNNLVNINTATYEELLTINGIGSAKAEAIIKYREENGKFNSIEDIKNVSGIGDSLFEKIKAYITV